MRETTLGQLCLEGGGGIQTGPFGSQLHASDYVKDGVPSVMPQNIIDNRISPKNIARISSQDADRLSKYLLQPNDIVYSRRGDVEKRALVKQFNAGWLCGTGCLRVRLGPDAQCDARYVSYYLGTESSRSWIRLHAVGATMPNLNTAILSSFPISLPPLDVQRSIADILDALDQKIDSTSNLVMAAGDLLSLILWGTEKRVALGDLGNVVKTTHRPNQMGSGPVSHYSLPSFDAGKLPVTEHPSNILSNKIQITRPSVLISKLNPRIPRVWDVIELGDYPAYCSTEFVVLEPAAVSTSELAAAVNHSDVINQISSLVAGTSGSHQRVKPDDLLGVVVPDARALDKAAREAISSLGYLIFKTQQEGIALARLRDSLLPKLIAGELVIYN